ncbi:MAG: hypothetical protein KAH95_02625 [Spirochaetales bacterium]|nr:hypothetical protein [Spirochaetales bacterium]
MKKFYLILVMLLIVTSLWAYQGKRGIGLSLDLNTTTLTVTEESTFEINWEILFTFMLGNKLEIAPYFASEYSNETTGDSTTDGYMYFGFGTMVNWHFIQTRIITMAAGLDIGYWFGQMDESVYTDNSYSRFNYYIPLIVDLNLSKYIIIRIRQDIWKMYHQTWMDTSSEDRYTESYFVTYNGFAPQFGLIFCF